MPDSDLDQDALKCNSDIFHEGEVGFLPWVFVQTGFPHGAHKDSHYERYNGKARLEIVAGKPGMPYGKVPRLVLTHLTATFKRTGDRHIPLGRSQRGFLDAIGMNGDGRDMRRLRDQVRRLVEATIRAEDGSRRVRRALIADESRLWWEDEGGEQLFPNYLVLSERFAKICARATPLKIETYRGFRSSLSMDVYAWLTYRCSNAKKPTRVPWPALEVQFGHGYSRPRDFRTAFKRAVGRVLVHYPCRVDEAEGGIVVHPHAPDVPRLFKAAPLEPNIDTQTGDDLSALLNRDPGSS